MMTAVEIQEFALSGRFSSWYSLEFPGSRDPRTGKFIEDERFAAWCLSRGLRKTGMTYFVLVIMPACVQDGPNPIITGEQALAARIQKQQGCSAAAAKAQVVTMKQQFVQAAKMWDPSEFPKQGF